MTERITWDQMEALVADKDATLAKMIERTCLAINQVEGDIRTGLAHIAHTAERIERALAKGQRLNSLGEFQRVPMDVDRCVTLRATHWETLGHLIGTEKANALAEGK